MRKGMQRLKRFLAGMLSTAMVLTSLPVFASAEDTITTKFIGTGIESITVQEWAAKDSFNLEFEEVGEAETLTFASDGAEASFTLQEGHYLTVEVQPKEAVTEGENKSDAYILLSDSFTSNLGQSSYDLAGDNEFEGFRGKYLIWNNRISESGFTITAYAPVEVRLLEARGKNHSSGSEKNLTYTRLAGDNTGTAESVAEAGKIVTNGGAIRFKSTLEPTLGETRPSSYFATLQTPSVYYYKNGEKQEDIEVDPITDEETGEVTEYEIKASDVAKAIKAGSGLYIQGEAEAIPFHTLTVNVGGGLIKEVSVVEYVTEEDYRADLKADNGFQNALQKAKLQKPSSGEFENEVIFRQGDFLALTGYTERTGFDGKVFTSTTIGNDGATSVFADCDQIYELGTLNADTEVSVQSAYFLSDRILFNENPESDDYSLARTKVGDFVNASEALKAGIYDTEVKLTVTGGDYKYRLLDNATVKATGGESVSVKGISTGSSAVYPIPFSVLAEAALKEGNVIFDIGVKKTGLAKPSIAVSQKEGTARTVIRVSGEVMKTGDKKTRLDNGDFVEINRGANAQVTVTSATGYELSEVFAVKKAEEEAKIAEILGTETEWTGEMQGELEAWIKSPENLKYSAGEEDDIPHKAEFTIENVTEDLMIHNYSDPYYTLLINGEPVSREQGYAFDVNWSGPFEIEVALNGEKQPIDSTGEWMVSANLQISEDEDPDNEIERDVKAKVFGTLDGNKNKLTFDGTEVQGQMVIVTIGESEGDARFVLSLQVNARLTGDDVRFAAAGYGRRYLIGTTETYVLSVSDLIDPEDPRLDHVEAVITGMDKELLETWVVHREQFVTVYVKTKLEGATKAEINNLAANDDLKLSIYDGSDPSKRPLSTTSLAVINQVNKVVLSRDYETFTTDYVKVIPGTDRLRFDFTEMAPSSDEHLFFRKEGTEGIYYLINVDVGDTTDAFIRKAENLLIPASVENYDLILTKDDDSYEPNEIPCTVSVRMVHITGTGEGGTFDPNLVIAESTEFTNNGEPVYTVAGGTYPVKISFKKNTKLPKTIYSTMGEMTLGTVQYAAFDKKKTKYASVQRIEHAELVDSNGEVLCHTKSPKGITAVRTDGDTVYLNPSRSQLRGKYTLVVYAVEPKGKEVTCTFKLDIRQGIEDLDVEAPERVRKLPGKEASFKATVSYEPSEKPYPVKKVTWSLTDDKGNKVNYGKNITIKNGTVKIGKKVTIPEEGLTLYVCATAADYKGHDLCDIVPVEIRGVTTPPAEIRIGNLTLEEGGEYYSSDLEGELSAYDAYGEQADVTFTVKGISKDADGKCFAKAVTGKNKASVTAASRDGSKAKYTVNFTVKSAPGLRFGLFDAEGESILENNEGKFTAVNPYAAGKPMILYVAGEENDLISHDLTVKGAKKISSGRIINEKTDEYYPGTAYRIDPTAETSTLTIKDKTMNRSVKITVTNDLITKGKTKTSVSASNQYDVSYNAKKKTVTKKDNKGKIFNALYFSDDDDYRAAGSYNKVTYTVKKAKNIASGKVVLSTSDEHLREIFENNIEEGLIPGEKIDGREGEFLIYLLAAPSEKAGTFTVEYADYNGSEYGIYYFYIPAGKHKFTVTPVTEDENGVLKADAKSTTVTVNAGPAPKAKVVVNKTVIKDFDKNAILGFKTANNIVFSDAYRFIDGKLISVPDGSCSANVSGRLLNVNNGGRINPFSTAFTAESNSTKVEDLSKSFRICLWKELIKGTDYTAKDGISGWVQLKWQNLDGSEGTSWVKVTLKPKGGTFVPDEEAP